VVFAHHQQGKAAGAIESISAEAGIVELAAQVGVAVLVKHRPAGCIAGVDLDIGARHRLAGLCLPHETTVVLDHGYLEGIGKVGLCRAAAARHNLHQNVLAGEFLGQGKGVRVFAFRQFQLCRVVGLDAYKTSSNLTSRCITPPIWET